MIGNPRYGKVGLGAMLYIAFFEGLGPLLEGSGYLGDVSWRQRSVFSIGSTSA
jgi:hypothetical protein